MLNEFEIFIYQNQLIQKDKKRGTQNTYFERSIISGLFNNKRQKDEYVSYKIFKEVKDEGITDVIYIKKYDDQKNTCSQYFFVKKIDSANLYELFR